MRKREGEVGTYPLGIESGRSGEAGEVQHGGMMLWRRRRWRREERLSSGGGAFRGCPVCLSVPVFHVVLEADRSAVTRLLGYAPLSGSEKGILVAILILVAVARCLLLATSAGCWPSVGLAG